MLSVGTCSHQLFQVPKFNENYECGQWCTLVAGGIAVSVLCDQPWLKYNFIPSIVYCHCCTDVYVERIQCGVISVSAD